MKCCKCGKELPEHARFCKYCGAEQAVIKKPVKPVKKKSRWPVIAASILVLIVIGISGYIHFSGKEVPELVQDIAETSTNDEIPPAILMSYAGYDSEGNLYYSFVYKYSEDGFSVERTGLDRDYETKGLVEKMPEYYELLKPYETSKYKSRKTYDKTGNLRSEEEYSDDRLTNIVKSYTEKGTGETITKYDANGNRILYRYSLNGELVGETKWIRDEKGNLLNEEITGEQLIYTTGRVYSRKDDQGNDIARCTIGKSPQGEKEIRITYFERDPYGNIQKSVSYKDGILSQVVIYTYRTIENVNDEVIIPERRDIEENMTDDFSMFEEEIRQESSD